MNATDNFKQALSQLEKYLVQPVEDERDLAGVIQAFEFTFEQLWKSIQKLAKTQGVRVASPKKAFAFAIDSDWIPVDDEDAWLQMIEDRNLTSHTYQQKLAQEIFRRIEQEYLHRFQEVLATLEQQA